MLTAGRRTTVVALVALAIEWAPATALAQPGRNTVCQQVATNVGVHFPATNQVIVVLTTPTTSPAATLEVATRTPKGWFCGPAMSARVGKNGVRPLLERRSGDGTTPAGIFPLGTMTAWDGQGFSFFGNAADPGVTAGTYRRVQPGDCFGATPNHPDYGHLVYRTPADCPGPDDEYLAKFTSAYVHAALIGANMEPNVSGDAPDEVPYASAIFLHRFSLDANGNPMPTSGCVSLGKNNLISVLTAMEATTMFAIGEGMWLLAHSR